MNQSKNTKRMKVLYVRVSTLDQKTDRQRVNEAAYDYVIEDKCSGAIPCFSAGGRKNRFYHLLRKV